MTEINCAIQGHICTICGQTKHPLINHPCCNPDPTPEEIDKELVATMYQIRVEYQEMRERMNHFEAWFINAFDRIGTNEKHLEGLKQQILIFLEGR